jgi:hypothetical protein
MLIYLDGCSWVAGAGLNPDKNLANSIAKIDPSITVIDFSYNGKSNDSIFEDVFNNRNILNKIDRYVIGLSTPFRYCIHTDDDFRIDIIQNNISTIRYTKGDQPNVPPNNINFISETIKNYGKINSQHHYEVNTIKNYYAIKEILDSKLLAFSVYRYDSDFFQNIFDLNTWLVPSTNDGIKVGSDCFLPDKHLNETGMMILANTIVKKLKISYNTSRT